VSGIEPADDAGPAPTRGIDPPTSGYAPPPPPVVTYAAEPEAVEPATPPQGTTRPWAVTAVVVSFAAVLVLLLGLVVVGVSSLLSLADDSGEAAPSSEIDDSGQSDPSQGQTDPGSNPGSGAVATSLQAMIDEYKTARDNGSLWNTLADTEYNRTALSAFLYLLTDLSLAASFGADTSDYQQQANELEQKLLNGEPLGSDVTIKLSDRTFTYDGDTGEGGYTAN